MLGITGCMAEHLKDKIRERAPYVDLVVGPDSYRRLLEHVDARARPGARVRDTRLDRARDLRGAGSGARRRTASGVIGLVTIQRGCDKFCTFCVVPYTRGRERGTPPREILRQVRALAAAGYKEVQLLGQTVNSYRYEDVGFAELLRAVAARRRHRARALHLALPARLLDRRDRGHRRDARRSASTSTCRCRAGRDAVLERMRRGYDFATFRALVADLRAAMPGHRHHHRHPGRLLRRDRGRVRRRRCARRRSCASTARSCSPTREREGTYAARKMPDTVPEAVKQRRLAEVIAVQQRITARDHARRRSAGASAS